MAKFPAYYLYALNIYAGFSRTDAIAMTAIVLAESDGVSDKVRTMPGQVVMTGLYQIPSTEGANWRTDGKDVVKSAQWAKGKFTASRYAAWDSYRTGKYLSRMPEAVLASNQFVSTMAQMKGPDGQPYNPPAGTSKELVLAATLVGLMGASNVIGQGLSGAVTGAGNTLSVAVPAAVEGLVDTVASLPDAVTNIGKALSAMYDVLRWFTVPANLWRVAKFLMGVVMVFLGGMALIKDTSLGKAATGLIPAGKLAKLA